MLCYIMHRYYAFDIGEPEVVYAIHISVQQREYVYNMTTKREEAVWKTVGEAAVGPKVFGHKIKNNKVKESPEVCENVISTGIMTECSVGYQAFVHHMSCMHWGLRIFSNIMMLLCVHAENIHL